MAVKHTRVSAHVKKRRRIVNFQKPLRIFRFVPVQQPAAKAANLSEFLFGVPVCLLGLDRPRGRRGQVTGLEFRERRAEHIVRRPELAQQFSGEARAEARRH